MPRAEAVRGFELAEALLTFTLSKETRDSALGCIREDLEKRIIPKYGARGAYIYLFKEVAGSLLPLGGRLLSLGLKLLGLAELYERLSK